MNKFWIWNQTTPNLYSVLNCKSTLFQITQIKNTKV